MKIQGKSLENISLGMQDYVASTFSQGNGLSVNAPSIVTSPANSEDTFPEFPNLSSEFEVASDTGDLDLGANLEDIVNLDISTGSIPLLEQTPCIIDDVTPNLSLDTTVDESENVHNYRIEGGTSIHGLLLEAGYTPLEIENMSSNGKQRCDEGNYGRSRPQTHVFYQGKTFTYEKLEVERSGGNKSVAILRKDRASSNMPIPTFPQNGFEYSITNLNPEAKSFTSNSPVIDSTQANKDIKLSPDALTTLKNIRINNLKNVIIGQLNINSLRNKFSSLIELIHGNIDILVITETKLDHTFPEKQFLIPGYKKPYRRDRNANGGGVMIYVREDIPSDVLIKHKIQENIEAVFVEINLRKNKLLLVGTYHSTHEKYGVKDQVFFDQISLALDVYPSYDKFLLAGDFNVREEDDMLDEFMNSYHAKNLVKEPTCFMSKDNPSCIDLFITNSYQSFQKTTTVTTGLSDFHKMTVTILKTTFPKSKPRVITYRTPYEITDLENALKANLEKMKENNYENFQEAVKTSYDSVSSVKQ